MRFFMHLLVSTQTFASPPLTVLWLLWALCGKSWGGAAKTSAVGVLSCTVLICSSRYCRRHSVHFSQPHPCVRPVVGCQRSCGRVGQHAHQHGHQDHKFAAVDSRRPALQRFEKRATVVSLACVAALAAAAIGVHYRLRSSVKYHAPDPTKSVIAALFGRRSSLGSSAFRVPGAEAAIALNKTFHRSSLQSRAAAQ
jgi:hypothetical protein